MVIFGAGASFDSVDGHNFGPDVPLDHQPPLAEGLFAAGRVQGSAVERFSQCRALLPRLRKAVEEGVLVEHELEAIRSEADNMPSHQRMLTAVRFYLQALLKETATRWAAAAYGVTNYVDLLYQLEKWRSRRNEQIALVSFNYDT